MSLHVLASVVGSTGTFQTTYLKKTSNSAIFPYRANIGRSSGGSTTVVELIPYGYCACTGMPYSAAWGPCTVKRNVTTEVRTTCSRYSGQQKYTWWKKNKNGTMYRKQYTRNHRRQKKSIDDRSTNGNMRHRERSEYGTVRNADASTTYVQYVHGRRLPDCLCECGGHWPALAFQTHLPPSAPPQESVPYARTLFSFLQGRAREPVDAWRLGQQLNQNMSRQSALLHCSSSRSLQKERESETMPLFLSPASPSSPPASASEPQHLVQLLLLLALGSLFCHPLLRRLHRQLMYM